MTRYQISQVDAATSLRPVAEIEAASMAEAALQFARRHYRRRDVAVVPMSIPSASRTYAAYRPAPGPWRPENALGFFRVSRAAGQFPIARTDPDHPEYQAADAAEEN